jgi:ATP-dependent DNA helicase PIF1
MLQTSALDILKTGNNVFLTGSAGSGKTYVLNNYIKYLREHRIVTAITASTGIAATHIGGMTIHAWSGIGIRDSIDDYAIDQLEQKKYLFDRYRATQVLIIDEISMLSGQFLDMVERICRIMRRSGEPFGGMQVILCGDLFQLPPVSRDGAAQLITDSVSFKAAGFVTCYLTEQYRQDDENFLDLLNAMRANEVQDYHVELLRERIIDGEEIVDDNVHTKLFTHNVDVDAINATKLDEIDQPVHEYAMTSRGSTNLIESLKRGCLAHEILHLKLGAEVLCIKNNPEAGYVNGTRGVVMDFSEDGMPIIETRTGATITIYPETWSVDEDGHVKASISQIPLRHAWAITIHKSQGMSLDSAVIDLSKSFAYGMGYVALSRVRRLSGVHLMGLGDRSLLVDPRVLELDVQLREMSDTAEDVVLRVSEGERQAAQEEFILKSGGILEAVADAPVDTSPKEPSYVTTWNMIQSGKTIDQAAELRDVTTGTIIKHLEDCIERSLGQLPAHVRPDQSAIDAVFSVTSIAGDMKLSDLRQKLIESGHSLDYDTIRLAKMCV